VGLYSGVGFPPRRRVVGSSTVFIAAPPLSSLPTQPTLARHTAAVHDPCKPPPLPWPKVTLFLILAVVTRTLMRYCRDGCTFLGPGRLDCGNFSVPSSLYACTPRSPPAAGLFVSPCPLPPAPWRRAAVPRLPPCRFTVSSSPWKCPVATSLGAFTPRSPPAAWSAFFSVPASRRIVE